MSQIPETPNASEKRSKPWSTLHRHLKKLRPTRREKVAVESKTELPAELPTTEIEPVEHETTVPNREQTVEKGLEAIYFEGNRPADLTTLERARSWRWLGVLIFFAAVGGLIWGLNYGVNFFNPLRNYQGAGLKLAIQGPNDITLGQEEMFTFDWSNPNPESLHNVELHFSFPQEFQVTSIEPALTATATWRYALGEIASGEHGSITVKGIFMGALNDRSAVQVLATYQPAQLDRNLEAVANQPVTYTDTILTGNIILPPKIMVGDPVTLRYVITNRGSQTLSGLTAHLVLPVNFTPAPSMASGTLSAGRELFVPLSALAAEAFGAVQVSGSFVSGFTGESVLVAETGHRGSDGKFLALQRMETRLPVVAGDLALHLVVNGSDVDQTLDPGAPISLAIGYDNSSPEALKGVSFKVTFESNLDGRSVTGTSLVNWSRMDNPQRGVTSTRPRLQTLAYDKKQLPELESLPPLAEGLIEATLATLPAPTGTRDAWIKLSLEGRLDSVGEAKVNRVVSAKPITLRYQSHTGLAAEARYFTEEGAPVGNGPLPPVVGKTTSYRLIWRVTKAMHPLRNVTLTATLPKIVAWGGNISTEVGELFYDEQTRQVRWTIKDFPEGTRVAEANFDLRLTPTQLDAGRFADLMGETRLEAQDVTLEQAVAQTAAALNSDLRNDEGASGKGVVRQK